MGKLVFALLLAGVGLLTPSASLPTVIEVQPASGESVDIRVAAGEGILFKASGTGVKAQGRRVLELTAPGTLEITGGDGAMTLSAVDGTSSFVLSIKTRLGRITRVLEARGNEATVRVLGGNVEIDAPTTRIREARTP